MACFEEGGNFRKSKLPIAVCNNKDLPAKHLKLK
jgi:hypothetical protein